MSRAMHAFAFRAGLALSLAAIVPLAGCRPSESAAATKNAPQAGPRIVYSNGEPAAGSAAVPASDGNSSADAGRHGSSISLVNDPNGPVFIKDIVRILRAEGLTATDRTPDLVPAYRRALIDSTAHLGCSDTAALRIGSSLTVVAVEFMDGAKLEALLASPPDLILFRNIVLAPAGQPGPEWDMAAMALERVGGHRIEPRARESAIMLSKLQSLRNQLEAYKRKKGRYPDLANAQWKDMMKANLLTSPPRNLFSPSSVAEKIEIVNTMGSSGESVRSTKAGWVWNSADLKLFAAGLNEEKLRVALDGVPGGKHYIATPEMHITAGLNVLRQAHDDARKARLISRKAGYPTLSEVRAILEKRVSATGTGSADDPIEAHGASGAVPENIINRSAQIQLARWKPADPPISGGAGWNFDEKAGKFWANTNVVGENRY